MNNKNSKLTISILIGIMCMFLTFGISVQIKTVRSNTTTIGKTQSENQLRDSVLRWKEKYDSTSGRLEEREQTLEQLRNDAASSNGSASDLSSKLEKYNLLLGYSDMVGKGIIVTLKDGDSTTGIGLPTNYIVHDEDLIEVVNALKNAGAEAISINDHRIVSKTGISCVGNVITINNDKVGAPFVIKALGSPTQLYSAMTIPGGYIELLKNAGVQVKIEQDEKEKIVIPKFEGTYKYNYAKNVE